MRHHFVTRRALAVLALGGGIALGGATPALAAAPTTSVVASSATFVAPPDGTGTVTINALRNQPVDTVPVTGAVFTVAPVLGIDLDTEQGWALAAGYLGGTATKTPALGASQTLPATDGVGRTSKSNLAKGLYRLHYESSLSSPGLPNGGSYADLYLALPSKTTDSPSLWAYSIVVTPKPYVPATPQATPTPTPSVTMTPTPSVTPPPSETLRPNGDAGNETVGPPSGDSGSEGADNTGNLSHDDAYGSLAKTGATVGGFLAAGLLAIGLGAGAIGASRRRKEEKAEDLAAAGA